MNRLSVEFRIIIFFLTLFLILVPFVWQIDYWQNDEYAYYLQTIRFRDGDFTLLPELLPTFVTQGILGAVVSFAVGMNHLPVLTLFISLSCVTVFSLLLRRLFDLSSPLSVLFSLLLFVNPLYLYSTFGYMTDVYFLLFFILGLYFFYQFDKKNSSSNFLVMNVPLVLGFGVRQVSILFGFAAAGYFLLNRKYMYGVFQLCFTVLLYAAFTFLFPQTAVMQLTKFHFTNLVNIERTASLLWVILIYSALFTVPFIINLVFKVSSRNHFLLVSFSTVFIGALFMTTFNPSSISHLSTYTSGREILSYGSAEFPYLGNTFTRKGFFSDNLGGDKYYYPGYFDLFRGFNLIGISFAILALALFIVFRKKQIRSFEFIYMCLYIFTLLVLPKVYDRYLLPLVPILIVLLLRVRKEINYIGVFALSAYLLFFGFIGYQFSMDFYKVNKYVWNKSLELSVQGVERSDIKADNSWVLTYPNVDRQWQYYFGYSGIDEQLQDMTLKLVEKKKVEYPLNIYIDPYIYLYSTH